MTCAECHSHTGHRPGCPDERVADREQLDLADLTLAERLTRITRLHPDELRRALLDALADADHYRQVAEDARRDATTCYAGRRAAESTVAALRRELSARASEAA